MDNKTLSTPSPTKAKKADRPFRNAVLRGLGVVVPPLLTIVFFLWVGGMVNQYVLLPVTTGARDAIVWKIEDIRDDVPAKLRATPTDNVGDPGKYFYETPDHKFVPLDVYDLVRKGHGAGAFPQTADDVYKRYVELRFLPPQTVIPAFLAVFIIVLYLLGKFMAAGIGRLAVGTFERVVLQLPFIRPVYSSVKQISDFLFSSREVQFSRVVAVQYPRLGIWSLGFVTGESFVDVHAAAGEPMLSVLIPTSPMPVTGYTVNVKKSEAVDLDITVDQAIQFIVSCGVVVPPHQLQKAIEAQTLADEKKDR